MIADYTWNGSTESPARQYVNGTQYIDERVVMRDIAAGGKDYYYLHEELYSVAGMAASNGMLKEAVVYDTYGEATLYKWLPGDIDRDGTVEEDDYNTENGWVQGQDYEPLADLNVDWAVNTIDLLYVRSALWGQTAQLATYSSVGNPYLFTGRTTDTLCATSGLVGTDPTFRRIQDNRNRAYDPHHGRWFQRDPLGVRVDAQARERGRPPSQYSDGANLHEYAQSSPVLRVDWNGEQASQPGTQPASQPCGPVPGPGVEEAWIPLADVVRRNNAASGLIERLGVDTSQGQTLAVGCIKGPDGKTPIACGYYGEVKFRSRGCCTKTIIQEISMIVRFFAHDGKQVIQDARKIAFIESFRLDPKTWESVDNDARSFWQAYPIVNVPPPSPGVKWVASQQELTIKTCCGMYDSSRKTCQETGSYKKWDRGDPAAVKCCGPVSEKKVRFFSDDEGRFSFSGFGASASAPAP